MHDSAHAMKSRTNWKQAAGNLRPAETLQKYYYDFRRRQRESRQTMQPHRLYDRVPVVQSQLDVADWIN